MKNYFLIFVFFVSSFFLNTGICPAQPILLFKSGFETGVNITGTGLLKKIRGTDSISGYNWESDIPGDAENSMFNFLVCDGNNIEDFVKTKIETVIGPNGLPTRTLYHGVIKNDPCTSATSRSQYNIYPKGNTADDKLEQMYVRYWTKFERNLPAVLSWRLLMEWLNNDYRWGIYVSKDNNTGKPFWRIQGQLLPEKTIPWAIENREIPVPIDDWFLLEVFWKQDISSNGRLWVAINGKTIADYKGSNKRLKGIGAWCIFKNYGSVGSGQWIDDVEIWNDIPNQTGDLSLYAPVGVKAF
jgi:hypothetical protein